MNEPCVANQLPY